MGVSLLAAISVMQGSAQSTEPASGSAPDAQPSAAPQPAAAPQSTAAQPASQPNPNDSKTYATGQPLSVQSNEGFWGHLNPFARKKWVNRQLDPVKDRLNELDQLSASNARDIKDVDTRAQAGIHQAQSTADGASQQAASASGVAAQAQQTSQQSAMRTQQLKSTVANLDQYQPVSETEIRFRSGQTMLNAKAKDALDGIAADLGGQKGYLVEVQGFSAGKGQAGIQASQHLADSVVRYLVEEHNVPVYRIHVVGLGNASHTTPDGAVTGGNSVHVTLIHNSLAALNSSGNPGSSPIGATQQPRSAAPSPSAQQQ